MDCLVFCRQPERPPNEDQIVPQMVVSSPTVPDHRVPAKPEPLGEVELFLREIMKEDRSDIQSEAGPVVPSETESLPVPTKKRRRSLSVRRVSEDARPLTQAEIMMHQELLRSRSTAPPPTKQARVDRLDDRRNMLANTPNIAQRISVMQRAMYHPHGGASLETTSERPIPPQTPSIAPGTLSLTPNIRSPLVYRQASMTGGISTNDTLMTQDHTQSVIQQRYSLPSVLRGPAGRQYQRSMSQPMNTPYPPARHRTSQRSVIHQIHNLLHTPRRTRPSAPSTSTDRQSAPLRQPESSSDRH